MRVILATVDSECIEATLQYATVLMFERQRSFYYLTRWDVKPVGCTTVKRLIGGKHDPATMLER
jgi:hypothetical protein